MQFSDATIPTLPLLGVSEDEKALLEALDRREVRDRAEMALAQAFYLGTYVVANLRIAIPESLEWLQTILGWPAMAVDPYVERLKGDGFLTPGATDSNEYLADLMDANGFAAEQSLAYTDALSMGRCYWMVGSSPESGGAPVVTAESPLNMSVLWDLRGTSPRAARQKYWDGDRWRGSLLVPKGTVHLAQDDGGEWVVVDRDSHDFDFVPVVRMAHQATTNNRDGRSAITPAIRGITAVGCRTVLGLEVSREIHSVPGLLILGASESAFEKSDGSQAAAWDTYITSVLALERDADGQLPEIVQKQVYDPSTYTKILDWCASVMAGYVAAPPQDLGLYTQGNPTSAEAGAVSETRRDRRAGLAQNQFGRDLQKVAQMAVRFDNKGDLPAEFERLSVDWAPVAMETPGVTSDAITKQIAAGAIPATSDVTLKRLGYSAVERRRLEQDRSADDGRQLARALVAGILPGQQAPTTPAQEPTSGNPSGI